MSKLIKRLFLTVLIIVVLLVAAVVAAYFLIDANAFKQKIISEVNEATGRELTIDGDIKVSVIPWLGLRVSDISLSNAKGFAERPFAKIERAEFGIKLWPVFRKEIEADTITLHGLSLYLAKNKQGISNWADLVQPDTADKPQKDTSTRALPALAAFSIGGIDVRDAEVIWDDQQAPQKFIVSKFDLNSSAILPGQPVALKLDFDVDSQPSIIKGHMNLSGTTSIDLANQLLAVTDLKIDSTLGGDAVPIQPLTLSLSSDASLDMSNDTFTLNNFKAKTLGLDAKGQINAVQLRSKPMLKGQLDISEFSPRELLRKFDVSLDTADPNVLAKSHLNIDFEGSPTAFTVTSFGARLDDTQLNGDLRITEFAKPTITAKLKLDSIDLDRYLPPQETAPAPGAGSPPEAAPGTSAKTPDAATATAASDNSWMQPLRTLSGRARLEAGSVKVNKLTLSQLTTTVTAKGGLITLHPLTAALYGGSYQGNIQLNSNLDQPIITVDETLKDVAAGPLLTDLTGDAKILGTASAKAKLTMRGITPDEIRKTANGDIAFTFINGAVKGVNVAKVLRDAKAKLSGGSSSTDEPLQTDFAELSGSANIKGGVLQNQDLLMKSPFFRIAGRGKANLIDESIDYLTEVSVVETSKGQGGRELEELKGLTIPVKISGTFSAPKFAPDLEAMVGSKIKEKAKTKIEEKKQELKGKALEKLGIGEQQQPADGGASQTAPETPKEKLEDKLKEKLKGLF